MQLTVAQEDALAELINIGYGRAAAALSELTGYRITVEVPRVSMHELQALSPLVEEVLTGEVASVNQMFSGAISGNAMLLLDEKSALVLTGLLTDKEIRPEDLNVSAREVITEVGNILLNACLGVFGNLLRVHVSFSVPRLRVETVAELFDSITIESDEKLRYGLMIHTRFRIRSSNITGYFVIILGITSLDRMLREIERWEKEGQSP